MLALAALAFALQSPPDSVVQEHKFLIQAMVMADQDARNQMTVAMNNGQEARLMELMHDVERIDRANTATMKEIVLTWGWPTISAYGRRDAGNAWLLVQHADIDVPFQQKCLRLMEPLVAKKEVRGDNFAYLYDRVARNTGKPQRFGTQLTKVGHRMVVQEVEDPENLDRRRASVGMMPIKNYIKLVEEVYSRKS